MIQDVTIYPGDCLEVIPKLAAEGVCVDSVVTDPPYHLIQASRNGSQRINGGTAQFERLNLHGFMNQRWDGGDIAFRPETWAVIGEILKPGGYLLAFGGTRTFHRIWCSIEDAGFVIQDTIMWLYGSGFPKGRAQLKPAFEPICVAYKPCGNRVVQIDECRISTDLASEPDIGSAYYAKRGIAYPTEHSDGSGGVTSFDRPAHDRSLSSLGRWPANVCHDGSDEVMEAFAEFGEKSSGTFNGHRHPDKFRNIYGDFKGHNYGCHYQGNTGSAARFFYTAKANDDDRWGSHHPTVKPLDLMKWLVKLVTPKAGTCLDPFAGSGTTGVAALATGRKAILIEREPEYLKDIEARLAHFRGEGRHSIVVKNRARNEPADLPLFRAIDGTNLT